MRNSADDVIYVGKAVNLKNRVKQYFQRSSAHAPKIAAMVARVARFEYIITDSEYEALILECNLIKEHRPKYNVKLIDDKHYPYLKVTVGEEYPRMLIVRRVANDGSKHYGPYLNVHSIHDTMHEIRRAFPLKSCKRVLPRDIGKQRPCLNYHLGLCLAPCSGEVSAADYRRMIRDVCQFLDGRHDDIIRRVEAEMHESAEAMRYEAAGKLRDRLFALRHIQEKQKALTTASHDQDVIACYTDNVDTCVSVFFVRGGKLVGREQHLFEGEGLRGARALATEFVKQFYANVGFVPKEVILQQPIDDMRLVSEMLSARRGAKVDVVVPARGEKRALAALVAKNAQDELANKRAAHLGEESRIREGMAGLREILGLGSRYGVHGDEDGAGGGGADGAAHAAEGTASAEGGGASAAATGPPAVQPPIRRIEAYDVSNYGAADKVASMVVFEDGRPLKQAYRRFSIKGVEGQDDYACMQEALTRRLRRYAEGDEKFRTRPDLILVDGGKGHVSAALAALRGLGLDVPVAGMAKNERHETDALVTSEGEVAPLSGSPQLLRLISSMQDEAHRFAIAYSKKLSEKRLSMSELDGIRGVGKRRKMALIGHFKSLRNIREADAEGLAGAPGIDARTARAIYEHFHGAG